MDNDATRRMIFEVQEPLHIALTGLSPHSSKIQSSWRNQLKRYRLCAKHASQLSALRLAPRPRDLFADFDAFQEKSERQGRELARGAVPAECLGIAVGLYLEICLPYLWSDESGSERPAAALARLAAVYQYFLLSGYSRYAAV